MFPGTIKITYCSMKLDYLLLTKYELVVVYIGSFYEYFNYPSRQALIPLLPPTNGGLPWCKREFRIACCGGHCRIHSIYPFVVHTQIDKSTIFNIPRNV